MTERPEAASAAGEANDQDDWLHQWTRSLGMSPIILRNAVELDAVSNGVVFVVAQWSGPARSAFKRRCKELGGSSFFASIPVYAIDSDHLDDGWWKRFGRWPSGSCETLWINGGRIFAYCGATLMP